MHYNSFITISDAQKQGFEFRTPALRNLKLNFQPKIFTCFHSLYFGPLELEILS